MAKTKVELQHAWEWICAVTMSSGLTGPITMSSDKIDGVPEGWRLVGFRRPMLGEFVLDPDGTPYKIQHDDVTDIYPVICETDKTLRRRVGELEAACRAILASLEKLALDGEIIWLDPPHVLLGVHESAIERLKSVIEQDHEARHG